MSYILSIYCSSAFKEYLLPAINDANYSIVLSKNIFGLKSDIDLTMEVVDHGWSFLKSDSYDLYRNNGNSKDYCFGEIIHGGDIIHLRSRNIPEIAIVVKQTDTYFSVYEKYDISNVDIPISIGEKKDCTISYRFLNLISEYHAQIIKRNGQLYVEDISNKNGVFVNNIRTQRAQMRFGDCVDIYGLRIVILNNVIAVNTCVSGAVVRKDILPSCPRRVVEYADRIHTFKNVYFHRSPRSIAKIDTDPIEIESAPNPKELNQPSIFMTVGPALSMALPIVLGCTLAIYSTQKSGASSGIFMFTGLVTAVSSALLGTIWALVSMNNAKRKYEEDEENRNRAYGEYLSKREDEIRKKYQKNTNALLSSYCSAEECCRFDSSNPKLWNRNISQEDYLTHRLGIGDIPFQSPIIIPKDKFSLISDNLMHMPAKIKSTYEVLRNVPVCINLFENKLIGIFGGGNKQRAVNAVQSLIAQIAANNCYTDVKIAVIHNEKGNDIKGNWNFAKWLPHVWNSSKSFRYVAENKEEASDVFYEIVSIIRRRAEQQSERVKKEIPKPYYILVLVNYEMMEDELISKYVLNPKPEYGLTTLILTEKYEELPNECEYIIENSDRYSGAYHVYDGYEDRVQIRIDAVSSDRLERFARTIADVKVKEIESNGDIADSLSFMDMYGVRSIRELNVDERWKKNRTYDSMKALIGHKAGGEPMFLDIHEKYHGPHGLVAGTTGSGKSETLQTYILSLSINYSPYDVGFFIIDYKGGGMANLFSNLPHLIGQISNLSGNQVRRAMVAIKSENIRRQKVFNEYGVNNINSYTKMYKNGEADLPVPHMIIIIDEFAELKREEPDFMRELVSVAQVGRSLGVHLILATQKPSGTVDDNIWSNSKFRLCLRVQDKQDSNDMLHRPDAAYITQAGRGYMQVGNDELFELFQSGWSGAEYIDDFDESREDVAKMLSVNGTPSIEGNRYKIRMREKARLAEKKEKTQLEEIVDYLGDTAKKNGYDKSFMLWLPVLPKEIYYDELAKIGFVPYEKENGTLSVCVGLYDDPENQKQDTFKVDMAVTGNIAICGGVVSGKSTFLQTFVYGLIKSYTPEQVNIYALDFSSKLLSVFEGEVHIGGVVYEYDTDKVDKLFAMLSKELDRRKELLKGGNYFQYIKTNGAMEVPAIVTIIDNIANFRDKTSLKYDDILLQFLKEGIGYGIFFAISAAGIGSSELPNKFVDNIKTVIALEMNDKFAYSEIMRTMHLEVLPEVNVKGRGLAYIGDRILEFQTALAVKADDDYMRGQRIREISGQINDLWEGKCAKRIPEIPDLPLYSEFSKLEGVMEMSSSSGNLLPLGYDSKYADIYGIDLSRTYTYIISGRERTGKTNAMKVLMYSAEANGGRIVIVDTENDFETTAKRTNALRLTNSRSIHDFIRDFIPEIQRRNKRKHELISMGCSEEEIYEKMQEFEKIFVFIGDIVEFVQSVYNPGDGIEEFAPVTDNIIEKGALHNLYWFVCINQDKLATAAGHPIFKHLTADRKGFHLGGNLQSQRLLSFDYIPYTEQSKNMKQGQAMLSQENDERETTKVIIPLVKE